jgi:hypothetical protein
LAYTSVICCILSSLDMQESFCEEDADLLASMGYNSIRLGIEDSFLQNLTLSFERKKMIAYRKLLLFVTLHSANKIFNLTLGRK